MLSGAGVTNHNPRSKECHEMAILRFKMALAVVRLLLIAGDVLAQEAALKTLQKDWIQLVNGKDLDGWTVKIAKHKLGENFSWTKQRPLSTLEHIIRILASRCSGLDRGRHCHQ